MSNDIDPREDPRNNIARGLFAVARAIDRLGVAHATVNARGAIEALSVEIRNGFAALSSEIEQRDD